MIEQEVQETDDKMDTETLEVLLDQYWNCCDIAVNLDQILDVDRREIPAEFLKHPRCGVHPIRPIIYPLIQSQVVGHTDEHPQAVHPSALHTPLMLVGRAQVAPCCRSSASTS